ncbi:unnamed protein product [Eruca vesicaria subsp. sativa]|uniref:CASP-like protein n=1 Tax=Eruca vesicaria subsp. sativa TaxID=29727 RepID=A0ABC8K5E5_ERUVS|nr:unnamed protein product [Eruca vesicaria subsp. sativa]
MEVVGTASVGTRSSVGLRLGQVLFSSASLLFMCFNDDDDFYAYTAFCSYLVTVMGLVTPWSVTLALIEAYSIIVQRFPLQATVLSVIVSGDFYIAIISGMSITCFALIKMEKSLDYINLYIDVVVVGFVVFIARRSMLNGERDRNFDRRWREAL